MRAFLDTGFRGAIRPDHTPILAGESNESVGYHLLGRLHAVGFMQGLLTGLQPIRGQRGEPYQAGQDPKRRGD